MKPEDFAGELVYVASPYSDPDPEVEAYRYREVQRACVILMRAGAFPYSPIVHWHPAAQAYDLPGDAAYWERLNHAALRKCDRMVVIKLGGWTKSKGVSKECLLCNENHIPFNFISLEEMGMATREEMLRDREEDEE